MDQPPQPAKVKEKLPGSRVEWGSQIRLWHCPTSYRPCFWSHKKPAFWPFSKLTAYGSAWSLTAVLFLFPWGNHLLFNCFGKVQNVGSLFVRMSWIIIYHFGQAQYTHNKTCIPGLNKWHVVKLVRENERDSRVCLCCSFQARNLATKGCQRYHNQPG